MLCTHHKQTTLLAHVVRTYVALLAGWYSSVSSPLHTVPKADRNGGSPNYDHIKELNHQRILGQEGGGGGGGGGAPRYTPLTLGETLLYG